jgi:1-acyl-sn-glycerol-3-phosphate acyltransferase
MIDDLLAWAARCVTGVSPAGPVPNWTGKPCIFFANHGSNLDALVIWAALPREIRQMTSPVAARDYWTKNFIRRWISGKVFRAVLLNRKGRGDDRTHPLQEVLRMLESGRSIIIFPEGTRSPDGTLAPFKPGLFYLHEKVPECALIPVSLQNLNRILPKGQVLPVPVIGRIIVHEPLETISGEEREAFLVRARQAVAQGLKNQANVSPS